MIEREVVDACDKALFKLRVMRHVTEDEKIEWDVLHCASADLVIDEEGNDYWNILVRGASERAIRLRQHIERDLIGQGIYCEVATEWEG